MLPLELNFFVTKKLSPLLTTHMGVTLVNKKGKKKAKKILLPFSSYGKGFVKEGVKSSLAVRKVAPFIWEIFPKKPLSLNATVTS